MYLILKEHSPDSVVDFIYILNYCVSYDDDFKSKPTSNDADC